MAARANTTKRLRELEKGGGASSSSEKRARGAP